ncbi:MAG: transporter [Acidimicrobiales bacterium]|jgi:ABC-2 type transport system permease protein|nr:transporter [Acidimicrobiales bacterium]
MTVRTTGTAALPRLSLSRATIELKSFFRDSQSAVFTFLLPVMLLIVFSAVFRGSIGGPPGQPSLPFRQYFAAGMIASGIVSAAFTTVAISVAVEQHDGTLKRLAGTPLPKGAYFAGKVLAATALAFLSSGLMLAVGVLAYDLDLPASTGRWLALVWVPVLGIASCCLIGLAYTRLIDTAKGAAAVVMAPYLLLQFTSGVFFVFTDLPQWMQRLAALFPLKWVAQGLRYALLPDWVALNEPAQRWELGRVAAVLVAWSIAGAVLARATFRWDRSDVPQD